MAKRILSLILSLAIVLCSFSVSVFSSQAAEDDTLYVLASLVKRFPAGKYWNHMGSSENNPDGVTDTPCKSHSGCSWTEGACSCNSFDRAIQCMGYAHKIAYEITGYSPRASFTKTTTLSASKLRVGDIIRFRGDRHSICVTGVNGSQISFTDCNWDSNCIIRWGVMDISYIKDRSFTYVLRLEGNNRKNTNLTFYENPDRYLPEDGEEVEEPSAAPSLSEESWKMSDSNLNVRSTASLSGSKSGSIPANSEFKVTKKKIADGYLWGYVKYGSVKGWAALDYSEYKSGYYQKPDVNNAKSEYKNGKITFTWDQVDGIDYYLFKVYDSNKKALLEKKLTDNKYTVNLNEAGDYYVRVFTRSNHVSSWKISGKLTGFTYKPEQEAAPSIKKITLSKSSLTLIEGKSYTLTAKTEPEGKSDELIWSSSDKNTVSVSAGKLKALDCGKAKIVCSDKNGKIKAECEITVKPGNITGARQYLSKTELKSITFKWDKVSSADGYIIHRYNSSEKKYEKLGTVEGTSYTDTTVSGGKNYYYLIRAVAKTDSGDISGTSVKIKCSTRPAKVTGLKQSYSATGTFTLSWNKSKNAASYVIYKYDSSKKKYIKTYTVETNECVIKTNPGEKAYYKVYAHTKTDWGEIKSAASDKAYTIAGPAKLSLTLKSNSKGTATLKWGAVSGATHYYVYRNTSSGFKKIATLKSGTTTYTDKSLGRGSKQTYRIRAVTVKSGVTGYGSYSSKKTVTVK